MGDLSYIIRAYNSFAIYGARVVAYGAYTAIKHLYKAVPGCFVVSNLDNNPGEIDNIPVKTIDAVSVSTFIIVADTELLQGEVIEFLKEKGYARVFCLTEREEYSLMSRYYNEIGLFPVIDTAVKHNPVDLIMYKVCNHRDKPLINPPCLLPFERAIQAGADITDIKIGDISDNTGDNISARNKQYCEMTAVYWIWKNTAHDWAGIEHYRRRLLVTPELLTGDTEAVLPLPYMCYPNTTAQLRRFISGDVFGAFSETLRKLHPDKYNDYLSILNGKYQYTYNLLCAKRRVFNDYCAWFFNITQYMETLSDAVPEIAETRALSYIAEALTNIYFMSNNDRLRIKHTEKAIYI